MKKLDSRSPPIVPGHIYEGDCLDLMPGIADQSVDMVMCDLPYGTTCYGQKRGNQWDHVIPLPRLWDEYRRIVKPSGVIALTSHGRFTAELIMSNTKNFKYMLIWVKKSPTLFLRSNFRPMGQHEHVCIFYQRQPTYHPQRGMDGRTPTDVIRIPGARHEPGPLYHPTQKPLALGRYLLRTYTDPGDLVLDNACGTGTFPVAALMEGRRYIGIEKNSAPSWRYRYGPWDGPTARFEEERVDMVQIARDRLAEAERELAAPVQGSLALDGLEGP